MASHPDTPLARPIVRGTQGVDVIAAKRALSRAGFMEWGQFTDVCGDNMVRAIHDAQNKLKLPKAGYGVRTHHGLLGMHRQGFARQWAWDSYSQQLMHQEYVILHESPEIRIRKAIVQMWRYLYAHRYHIGYSQDRPFRLIHLGDPVPSHYDCSGFVAEGHYAGGAVNPNVMFGHRLPWNGEGYTGTLEAGGHRCTLHDMEPGDLIYYGFTTRVTSAFPYGSPTHVAGWDEGGNRLVWSMGSFPIKHLRYDYRHINCFVHYDVVNGR